VASPERLPLGDEDVVGAGFAVLAAVVVDAVASCVAGRCGVEGLDLTGLPLPSANRHLGYAAATLASDEE